MSNDWDDFINGLSNEAPLSTPTPKERFTCGQCAGTGQWAGGVNRHGNSKCVACRGKGYFTKSPQDRAAARRRRQERNKKELEAKLVEFQAAHPDCYADLVTIRWGRKQGTSFTHSLADQLFEKGSLSERQIDAWRAGYEKYREAVRQRAEREEAEKDVVDLAPIRRMFETAVANGYKRPKYRAEGLVITRAPDSGNNPGALYVKNENEAYGGKVIGTEFMPSRDGKEDQFTENGPAAKVLIDIAGNPLEAALRYGRRTGRCACCGRELTKHDSIDAGIGPVCREKWGL